MDLQLAAKNTVAWQTSVAGRGRTRPRWNAAMAGNIIGRIVTLDELAAVISY